MVSLLFVLTACEYAFAFIAFLLFAMRGEDRVRTVARRALAFAASTHALFLGADVLLGNRVLQGSVWQGLAIASLLTSVGYLGLMRTQRLQVIGLFSTPITLLLFLAAGLGKPETPLATNFRSVLLPLHISVNLLGIVLFTLASAVACAYLVQDRFLRQKKLKGLFRRLPPLDELDALAFRLVTIGFGFFTVGIVTGTFFMVRNSGHVELDSSRILALVAWCFFATVVVLRLVTGWRGRRAALATILGFACTIVVLLAYMLRSTGGGA